MAITIGWPEIAVRLTLTLIAGALIGFNRGEHGRPAGLRTIMLVCLAASLSMIQANLLLGTAGRPSDSFVMLDLMRLPLGILSGMGFIGGGAILKRGDMVLGVTTAATLWFVTVLGLCFGGGQIGLGLVTLAIGLIVLWGLKWLELQLPRERRGTLFISIDGEGPTASEIRQRIASSGFQVHTVGVSYEPGRNRSQLRFEVRWQRRGTDAEQPAFFGELAQLRGLGRVQWRPEGMTA
jgi:putative Mg2+ transporter-C (MgtC) family protein